MIKDFLDYVEIRTKITSVLTFFYVLAYFVFAGIDIVVLPTAVFFVAMLLFDMTATSINNYVGALKEDTKLPWDRITSLLVTLTLFILSFICGMWLVRLTNLFVLFMGALCFACGVLYSAGPIPIIRLPLGEILSGFFYGVAIPAILFSINWLPEFVVFAIYRPESLWIAVNLRQLMFLAILAIAPFMATANVMLANNVCDLSKDESFSRFTLPHYLGKKISLRLFIFQAYMPFVAFVALSFVTAGIKALPTLVALVAIIPIVKNTRVFAKRQVKAETFVCSLKNFVATLVAFAGAWLIAALIAYVKTW